MGVAEGYDVHRPAELPAQQFCRRNVRQHEPGAVGGRGNLGAGPLYVVHHANRDSPGPHDSGRLRQPLPVFHRVLVAPHRQHRRNFLEVIENAQAFQVAAVQNQVYAVQRVQRRPRQAASAARGVSVGKQADFHSAAIYRQ